ncbi:MAG: hypothetical protein NVSMB6_20070 [Burkholderiaceae bacterium]
MTEPRTDKFPSPSSDLPAADPGGASLGNVELKAVVLVLLMLVLIASIVIYLMYARGAFEATQTLILQADNTSGVSVGMDLTFSGFPIGRVQRIELSKEGKARMVVDVAKKEAHWLRTSSVFTLERGLVGGSSMRAYSALAADPPLPDGALRPLLVGDATEELPRVLGAAKELIQNLSALTAQHSALETSLGNLRDLTAKMNGPAGGLGVLTGTAGNAKRLSDTFDAANAFMAKANRLVTHADTRVFGAGGVIPQTQATVAQLNGLLADARSSLRKVDAVLIEAEGISSNVRTSTTDLGVLRAEVEANLLRIESLINKINSRWPFNRASELKLP